MVPYIDPWEKNKHFPPQAVTLLCPSLHFMFQSRQFAPHMMQHLGAIKTFTASRWVFHQLIWKILLNQIGSFPPYRDEHLFKKKSNHHSDSGGWNSDTTNAPRTSKIVFSPEGSQNCQRYDWEACYVVPDPMTIRRWLDSFQGKA